MSSVAICNGAIAARYALELDVRLCSDFSDKTMDLLQYQDCARRLCWGKRVNSALYVYCPTDWSLGPELDALVGRLRKSFGVPVDCNVVKFRLDERKVSFLSYPEFFEHAHPALKHVTAIDLVTGRVRITGYSENPNPPILHRKETFLPEGHPSRNLFSQLTLAEEEAGLFENTAAIGFKLNWERLLAEKGIAIDGHRLLTIRPADLPRHLKDQRSRVLSSEGFRHRPFRA